MEEIAPSFSKEGAESGDQQPAALDTTPAYGDPVKLEGRYELDPIPGGKRFQGAWLVLDDGTRHIIAYRPVPEHFAYLEKRVLVEGRPYVPGRDTQHVLATHLEVHSIRLAHGETPYLLPPDEPIAPPVVRTSAGLAARNGRWAKVIGTLESVCDSADGHLGLARLRLEDGTEVRARNVRPGEWSCLCGKTITVTSRVTRAVDSDGTSLELIGWYAVCESHEAPLGGGGAISEEQLPLPIH